MLALLVYLQCNSFSRVHRSSNMLRYREAYYEAFQIMVNHCTDKHKFEAVFDLNDLLQVPTASACMQEVNNTINS